MLPIRKKIVRSRSVKENEEPKLVYESEKEKYNAPLLPTFAIGIRKGSITGTRKLFNISARFSLIWYIFNLDRLNSLSTENISIAKENIDVQIVLGSKRRSSLARGKTAVAKRPPMGLGRKFRERRKRAFI